MNNRRVPFSVENLGERIRTAACLFFIASAVVIIDRLAKYLVLDNMVEGQSVQVLPGVFYITLVQNTGAAFGLFSGKNQFFISASLAVIIIISAYAVLSRFKSAYTIVALGLILGGAAGNLIDRLLFGYIIDFLDLRVWPVFNIADSCITAGSCLVVLEILFNKKRCCTQ